MARRAEQRGMVEYQKIKVIETAAPAAHQCRYVDRFGAKVMPITDPYQHTVIQGVAAGAQVGYQFGEIHDLDEIELIRSAGPAGRLRHRRVIEALHSGQSPS